MAAYLYLAIAIISEVIATIALKASDGFTKLIPSILLVMGYGAAFYCLLLFSTGNEGFPDRGGLCHLGGLGGCTRGDCRRHHL